MRFIFANFKIHIREILSVRKLPKRLVHVEINLREVIQNDFSS